MTKRLSGKVAIVTGAGRNIGRAEALALAREGAAVLVNDLADAEATVAAIRAEGGEAYANADDVGSWSGGASVVEAAVRQFGRVDILVNNAGVVRPRQIDLMTEEEWDAVHDVSLKGTAAAIHAVAPHMMKQGGGVIVNTGSTSGLGHLYMANYSAAKEGVLGLTRTVARELGPYGVRCNQIRPINFITGMAVPEISRSAEDSAARGYSVNGTRAIVYTPERAMPVGDQVAALTVLLCLPCTAHVSGQDFFIMGDEVGLFPEPQPTNLQFQPGGWTLEALETPQVLDNLLGNIRNRYLAPVARAADS